MRRVDPGAEGGFTLLELVISIGLLGVIIVPITAGMLFGFANSSGTRDRLADSSSAQFVSSYFASDIQSAGSKRSAVIGTGVQFSGTGTCPASAVGETVELRLTIPDATATDASANGANPPRTTVIYYTKPPTTAGMPLELYRLECRPTKQIGPTLIVNYLDTNGFKPSCVPDAVSCRSVSVTLKVFNPTSKTATGSYDRSQFIYVGTRRSA